MPYFKKDELNLLFVHIPKTGGTSIEDYFSSTFGIELNTDSMYSGPNGFDGVSLQHQPYATILANVDHFNIHLQDIKILTIVRNPYTRIMSDLFYCHIVDSTSGPDDVYHAIKEYITAYMNDNLVYDSHAKPQYLFLIDEHDRIPQNITILRTESLIAGMQSIGYTDFNLQSNKNNDRRDYFDLLDQRSINLINEMYAKDFEYFGYEILGDWRLQPPPCFSCPAGHENI
jgi:hypothetical protein